MAHLQKTLRDLRKPLSQQQTDLEKLRAELEEEQLVDYLKRYGNIKHLEE